MTARRGVILVLLLIVLAVGVSVVGSLLFLAGGAPVSVPARATLYLKIQAPFDEVQPVSFLGALRHTETLRDVIDILRKAKVDTRVKTLVIMPQAQGAMWGQLQEVRAAILDFKSSGKPVTAFLSSGGAQEYFLASAADRIFMMPSGSLDLSGLATYDLFFRGALDKMGVYPDLLHIGDYKTYSNTFTEKGYTPAHREMSASLNHDWYDQLVKAIASGRKKSEADVIHAIDGGPYLANGAKAAGLIDVVGYEDQIDDAAPVQGTQPLDGEDYADAPVGAFGAGDGQRVALLYADGEITSGESSFDSPTGATLGAETFVTWLRKVRVDPTIRAIVVRIDSPGGSALASEAIWRELMLTKSVKPLVVSMGDVAASGGYYIALPADTIVAEPGTITGSIGVVTGKFVLADTLKKLGVAEDSVSDGQFAQIDSPFRPFTDAERARVKEQMQATYDLFVSRVAAARHQTADEINAVAQGRVWTGRQAQTLKLVDQLGGLQTAIQVAKQRAKLDLTKDVQLVVYPQKRSLYDFLSNPFGASVDAMLRLSVPPPADRALDMLASPLRLFGRAEPLTIMPEVFFN